MVEKKCAICNKIYYSKSNNSKYCSDRCRSDIKNEKRRNEIKELACPICKKRFKTSNIKKIYCSNDCNLMAKKIRNSKPALSKVCRYCSKTFMEANELDNLISVCEPCHRKIHSGDNHHTKFKETYKNLELKNN